MIPGACFHWADVIIGNPHEIGKAVVDEQELMFEKLASWDWGEYFWVPDKLLGQ